MPIQILLKVIIAIGFILLLFFPTIEKYRHLDNYIYKTCYFVYERIVPTDSDLDEWLRRCRIQSRNVIQKTSDHKKRLDAGNEILSELKVSHLELFGREESDAIWTDTDFENGIESRFIDGELVVTRVLPNSEALKRGVQRGDRVVLEANESLSPYEFNKWKGRLKLERRKKIVIVDLEPKKLVSLRDISVIELEGVKVVSVESFKSQYFTQEKLDSMAAKIKPSDKIVVDLRGNNGGNFIAGLRFLSYFICQPTIVGYMKKNKGIGRIGYFDNNMDDEYQIQTLGQFDSVALKTFISSTCLPKPVAILIDAHSKSTAEWVALAFRDKLKTPIQGATSSGELLVGIWYDISDIWGQFVKLSIPEAYYESIHGYQIEGRGISADVTLYPRRIDFELGYDSEVLQVVQSINKKAGRSDVRITD